MTTVGKLLRERIELAMRARVWEEVKDHLSSFAPQGDEDPGQVLKTEYGPVPPEIVIDVLSEIDADCIGFINDRIAAIDGSEVDSGKQRKSKKKDKPKAARGKG